MFNTKELNDKELDCVVGGAAPKPTAPVSGSNTEIKHRYDVILKKAGTKKVATIQVVNTILSCGLQNAKTIVENLPTTICEDVTEDKAKQIFNHFSLVGAICEIIEAY